jgi:hypothetical protein
VKDVEGLLRFGCVNNPDSNNYKNAVGDFTNGVSRYLKIISSNDPGKFFYARLIKTKTKKWALDVIRPAAIVSYKDMNDAIVNHLGSVLIEAKNKASCSRKFFDPNTKQFQLINGDLVENISYKKNLTAFGKKWLVSN